MATPLIAVNTRSWCKAYISAPQPSTTRPVNQPLPGVGAALAEAYMPVPIAWAVTVLSDNPLSNLQVGLQIAGIEGGWTTFPGLITLPVISSVPLPGRAIRVIRTGGTVVAGELITCNIAPLVWPAWAYPDALSTVAGFYRVT